jgi:hypothetical protein
MTTDEVELLLTRLDSLKNEHIHHNEAIQRIFYLSIILTASTATGLITATSVTTRIMLYLIVLLAFIALGWGTRAYVSTREEIESKRDELIEELENIQKELTEIDSLSKYTLKSKDYTNKRTKISLYIYYAGAVFVTLIYIVHLIYVNVIL